MFPYKHIDYGFLVEPKGKRLQWIEQVHGNTIVEATTKSQPTKPPQADGIWTVERKARIHVVTADCMPVLFFCEETFGPIAAIHSGWRGAMQGIVQNGLQALSKKSLNLHAILGPCILSCCFEVKQDFVESFQAAGRGKEVLKYLIPREGKTYFDLLKYIEEVELKGLTPERIHKLEVRCTYCSQPRLPSYRRDKTNDPRIVSWIEKK